MADSELRRTVRRCTATLTLVTSLLVLVVVRYLSFEGYGNDIDLIPVAALLSWLIFAGTALYLVGSFGRAAVRTAG